MPAGFNYNLNPDAVVEELCDVQTIHHKRGAYRLDIEGLTVGTTLPRFTPVVADLTSRTVKVVKNVKVVVEAAADATSVNVAKNSLAYVGMLLGTGAKGAKVTAIDTSNTAYDTLTLEAAFGVKIAADTVLFEASAAGGTTPKNTANFVIYESTKVEKGIVLVALIMRAYEIQEAKLTLPFSAKDKEALTSRFQFE